MGFNGFVCDGCCELVDFACGHEAGVCGRCMQFDLGDGCCYCLSCCQGKNWKTCQKCGEYICEECYSESHLCENCEEEEDEVTGTTE